MPMDTIKAFVGAAWATDADVTKNGMTDPAEVWSKPDFRTGSLELRRITTRQSMNTASFPSGVRTDFYELYWADLSAGTTLDAIENWLLGLLWRNPKRSVPPKVRGAWILLWLISLGIAYVVAGSAVGADFSVFGWRPYGWMGALPGWITAAAAAVVAWATARLVEPYVGRVVRYTRATPDNIAARRDIRERGLALLDALHDGEYERIIIVGQPWLDPRLRPHQLFLGGAARLPHVQRGFAGVSLLSRSRDDAGEIPKVEIPGGSRSVPSGATRPLPHAPPPWQAAASARRQGRPG
jgi:hypothetical protein